MEQKVLRNGEIYYGTARQKIIYSVLMEYEHMKTSLIKNFVTDVQKKTIKHKGKNIKT